jgi:hypothetical protein
MPRARKKATAPEPTPPVESMPLSPRTSCREAIGQLAQFVLPLLAGGLLLLAVLLGGHWLQQQQGDVEFAFADLDCPAPPGMQREAFLEETQYRSGLPDRLPALDATTPARLATALLTHPWVSHVHRVQRHKGGFRAELQFRRPVLAVLRAELTVDAGAVLLPRGADATGLPLLIGVPAQAMLAPGQVWSDPAVQATAAVAGLLHPHLHTLGLTAVEVECHEGEVLFSGANGRRLLLWGHPPGQEEADEAPAATKLERLLARPPQPGEECDVRPASGVKWRKVDS